MSIPSKLLWEEIKSQGFASTAVKNSFGEYYIGYGHKVPHKHHICASQEDAEHLLAQDLTMHYETLMRHCRAFRHLRSACQAAIIFPKTHLGTHYHNILKAHKEHLKVSNRNQEIGTNTTERKKENFLQKKESMEENTCRHKNKKKKKKLSRTRGKERFQKVTPVQTLMQTPQNAPQNPPQNPPLFTSFYPYMETFCHGTRHNSSNTRLFPQGIYNKINEKHKKAITNTYVHSASHTMHDVRGTNIKQTDISSSQKYSSEKYIKESKCTHVHTFKNPLQNILLQPLPNTVSRSEAALIRLDTLIYLLHYIGKERFLQMHAVFENICVDNYMDAGAYMLSYPWGALLKERAVICSMRMKYGRIVRDILYDSERKLQEEKEKEERELFKKLQKNATYTYDEPEEEFITHIEDFSDRKHVDISFFEEDYLAPFCYNQNNFPQ